MRRNSTQRKKSLFTPSDIVVLDFPGVTGIKQLIAQAQVENVTLLTTDDKVACYPGPIQAV